MMDLNIVILSEIRQRKTNIIWYHLYVECKKNDTNSLFMNRNRLTDLENDFMITEGKVGGKRQWNWSITVPEALGF